MKKFRSLPSSILGTALLALLTAAAPSNSQELLPALKVADWTKLGIGYIWKQPCSEVVRLSKVHDAVKELATERGIVLRKLEQKPSPQSDVPILILACTGDDIGTDRVLGITLGLERGVSYPVGDRFYSSRMFGEAIYNAYRFNAGYEGSQELLLGGVVEGFAVLFDQYAEMNTRRIPRASSTIVSQRPRAGLTVADWRRLPIQFNLACGEFLEIEPLIRRVANRYGFKVPDDWEQMYDSLSRTVSEPTIWVDCIFADPQGLHPFYRIDVMLVRPVQYSVGKIQHPGLVKSTPKLILGGAGSALGGLVTKELDADLSFTRVLSAFMQDLKEANE